MANLPDTEIAERMRIADEFKRRHPDKVIDNTLFGEPIRPRSKPGAGLPAEKALKTRLAFYESRKRRQGGVIGVCLATKPWRKRFRATHPDASRTYHACPIEAAEARNATFAAEYPGVEAVQCDLDAVWRKWGCNCGKHKRATK